MADIIKPDFNSIKYYKQTQHWWVSNNFDRLGLGDVKNIGSLMDFCHKKKPKDLQSVIDNDPILKKLDADIAKLNNRSGQLSPEAIEILKKYGAY